MTIEIKSPTFPESVSDGTVASWLKKEGESVSQDEVVAEIETDKVVLEVVAPIDGILSKIIKAEGEIVNSSEVIGMFTESSAAIEEPSKSNEAIDEPKEELKNTDKKLGPATKKILAENKIVASDVKPSGKDNRVTKADVINHLESSSSASARNEHTPSTTPLSNRPEKRVAMSRLRSTIAKRLVSVKQETAMLTTFNEVNMQPIFDTRNKYKEKFKEVHGVNLGFMSFFTRACALALQQYPKVNAFLDGEEMVMNDFVDVSIAVSSPKGLMVPVMRNVENMTMWEIEAEVKRLALKARDAKLTIPEMTGGTFTITNGGVFGSMLSTPIINPPQSAILGMHNIVERAVVENSNIVARPIMYVALSYDHRIIDGKESVGFLVTVKKYLENPETMLMGKDPMEVLMGL